MSHSPHGDLLAAIEPDVLKVYLHYNQLTNKMKYNSMTHWNNIELFKAHGAKPCGRELRKPQKAHIEGMSFKLIANMFIK